MKKHLTHIVGSDVHKRASGAAYLTLLGRDWWGLPAVPYLLLRGSIRSFLQGSINRGHEGMSFVKRSLGNPSFFSALPLIRSSFVASGLGGC